jgi:predicted RNase H-like nuclease (RuvC/YqgF family)
MKSTSELEKELETLKDHCANLSKELAKALQAYADEYQRRKELENVVYIAEK